MKVVYVAKVFAEWGGLERVWSDRLNALSGKPGLEFWIVTTDQGEHPSPYPLNEKIHRVDLDIRFVRQYRYGFLLRYLVRWSKLRLYKRRLLAFLAEVRPDLLVTNSSENVTMLNCWRGGIPLLVECHGLCQRPFHMDKMTLYKRLKAKLFYRTMSKVDRIVTLTEKDAGNWRRINPATTVISNIVHLNTTPTLSDCSAKRVIFVGRMDAQKGYQYLARIWAIVSESHPDWRLDMYGEGIDRAEYRRFVPQGRNVFPHTQTADILDRYKESSILLLTSVYEPFGLVMPEAMSCGVPVVAFDCPYGPSEIITDGENGFLVECFDVEAFAAKVCLLMDDVELRRRMGANAVRSAGRFAEDKIIPQWQQLFEDILNKKK